MANDPESNPYVLDCFLKPFPENPDNFDPDLHDAQEGFLSDTEARQQAVALIKGGRFKAIILYQDAGDEWKELERFPDD